MSRIVNAPDSHDLLRIGPAPEYQRRTLLVEPTCTPVVDDSPERPGWLDWLIDRADWIAALAVLLVTFALGLMAGSQLF